MGAGILKDEKGKIASDDPFPFPDDLMNLILSSRKYLGQPEDVLRRLETLPGQKREKAYLPYSL